MRFRTLLSLATFIPLAVTAVAVMAVIYRDAQGRSTEVGRQLLSAANARAGQQVYAGTRRTADLTRTIAGLADHGLAVNDSDALLPQLLAILRANPGITWISYSDPTGAFTGVYRDAHGRTCTNQSHITNGKTSLVEYVVAEDGTPTLLRRDADSGYDPRTRPFYVRAVASRDVAWLPPYVFYDQGIPGISCAMAVRGPDDHLRGVVSVDFDLNDLSEVARTVAASPNSEVMAFTSDLLLVAHSAIRVVPATTQGAQGKLLSLADVGDSATGDFYKSLATRPLETLPKSRGRASFVSFSHHDQSYIACVQSMTEDAGPMQWVATVAPLSDFAPSPWQFARVPGLITLAALLVAVVIASLLARRISTPLTTLVGASEIIGRGDLNVTFSLGPLYEFQQLNAALHQMLANLRDWVRLRASLNLAMEIQRRVLPNAPPAVPGFDLAGYCAYNEQAGGHYYDFVVVDRTNPQRFIVALGDVMGHGLPSAVLMAGVRSILRNTLSARIAPGTLLTRMNSLLFQDHAGQRSMAMCLACFDASYAGCIWASAGHAPPIVFDSVDRIFQELEGGDVPLGTKDDTEYGNYQFGPLAKHMIIFIGSRSVWENQSPAGEPFGRDRLKKVIADNAGESAEEIKHAILLSIAKFGGTNPAPHDITFVIIKEDYRPGVQPPSPPATQT
jgi:phosphoserine phosphatase RsbU/P